MKTENKYIIFYCDKCDMLAGVIQLLLQMYPDIEVKTSSDVTELLTEIEDKLPEYILVYMNVHDERYISVVKSIRESVTASDTPVVIYQALPDETELRKLSHRIENT
jgi:DNA-binding NarL/FixJ family response regulator